MDAAGQMRQTTAEEAERRDRDLGRREDALLGVAAGLGTDGEAGRAGT
jgi:hypothetical protein